jgi:hypothetical protein
MKLLEENIITRFDVPAKITTNNVKYFISMALNKFFFKYGIVLSHSSSYYPQGNGLAESNNKNIMNIVKNIIGDQGGYWWPPTYCNKLLLIVFSSTCSSVLIFDCGFYTFRAF